MGDGALIAIAEGCSLHYLNVSGCHQIGDAGVIAIARGCPQLCYLDVSVLQVCIHVCLLYPKWSVSLIIALYHFKFKTWSHMALLSQYLLILTIYVWLYSKELLLSLSHKETPLTRYIIYIMITLYILAWMFSKVRKITLVMW